MYNPKSCNALERPFYTPLEAALRWCGLIAHEADILLTAGLGADPLHMVAAAYPQWPCLRANAEKVLDAILNKELPHGRDGRTVAPDDHVARHRLTVRHSDLKAWMAKHYPDQKPPFLFDEIERTTHAAITVEALQALQAERDALKARLAKAEDWWELEGKGLKAERDDLRAKLEQAETPAALAGEPSPKSRNAYLRTIAALGHALIDGGTGQPHTDAGAILAALAQKGVEAPLQSVTLAGYLKQAESV